MAQGSGGGRRGFLIVRGGKREGSGRKASTEKRSPYTVRLTAAQREKIERLGGVSWIVAKLAGEE